MFIFYKRKKSFSFTGHTNMYYNVLHAGILDSCTEVLTPLFQAIVTIANIAVEPYEVLLYCAQGEEFS